MNTEHEITERDAELLAFFRDHSGASASAAKAAFPHVPSVDHRIAALASPEIAFLTEDVDTAYEPMRPLHCRLGTFRITPKGAIALDDYLSEKARRGRRERLTHLWGPIAVGLLAYLVGYALDHYLG